MKNKTLLLSFLISLFFYWLSTRKKTTVVTNTTTPAAVNSSTVDMTARDSIRSLLARLNAVEQKFNLGDFE